MTAVETVLENNFILGHAHAAYDHKTDPADPSNRSTFCLKRARNTYRNHLLAEDNPSQLYQNYKPRIFGEWPSKAEYSYKRRFTFHWEQLDDETYDRVTQDATKFYRDNKRYIFDDQCLKYQQRLRVSFEAGYSFWCARNGRKNDFDKLANYKKYDMYPMKDAQRSHSSKQALINAASEYLAFEMYFHPRYDFNRIISRVFVNKRKC